MSYIYLIEVKTTAPANCRPRTRTHKGVGISNHKDIGEKLKEKAVKIISDFFTKEYPNIRIKYSAKVEMRKNTFALDIDDELDGIGTVRIPIEIEKGGEQ